MSATRGHSDIPTGNLEITLQNKLNQRRPLPHLPSVYCRTSANINHGNNNHNTTITKQSDETLYYKGLQARVASERNGKQFQMSRLSKHEIKILPLVPNTKQRLLAPLQLNYLGYHEGQQPISKPVRYFGSNFDLTKSNQFIAGPKGVSSKTFKLDLDVSSSTDFNGFGRHFKERILTSPSMSNKSLSVDNLNNYQRANYKTSLLSHLLPFSKFKKSSTNSKSKLNTTNIELDHNTVLVGS